MRLGFSADVFSVMDNGFRVPKSLFDLRGHVLKKLLFFRFALKGSGLANRPSQAPGNLLRRLTPKNNHF